jgi:hypothetical protein
VRDLLTIKIEIEIKPKPKYILNNPAGVLTNFEVLKSMQVHNL